MFSAVPMSMLVNLLVAEFTAAEVKFKCDQTNIKVMEPMQRNIITSLMYPDDSTKLLPHSDGGSHGGR